MAGILPTAAACPTIASHPVIQRNEGELARAVIRCPSRATEASRRMRSGRQAVPAFGIPAVTQEVGQ
jgi:hypothetical protein